MLALATCEGARALGLGDVTGSLEPGKQADVIVVDHTAPHQAPHETLDPYATLVHAARATDVRLTMVAGRILYRDGDVDDARAGARGRRGARRGARAGAPRGHRPARDEPGGADMLIGPCTVVTGGTEPHVLEDSAVRVVGAHIAAIGPLPRAGAPPIRTRRCGPRAAAC